MPPLQAERTDHTLETKLQTVTLVLWMFSVLELWMETLQSACPCQLGVHLPMLLQFHQYLLIGSYCRLHWCFGIGWLKVRGEFLL